MPSEILVKRLYIPDCKISLAFFVLYVRTYASTDCTGRVGKTIKGREGVSGVPWQIQIFYIGHSQYGQSTAVKTG